ncbi:MAG: hypothetical protein FWF57_01055 [Defluviitaleaceae bacterium]|nr:hypothetical protein [Defluviitaleaceae bacterium]
MEELKLLETIIHFQNMFNANKSTIKPPDVNKYAINHIKQATYFLDEKYQKPFFLLTKYIEAKMIIESNEENKMKSLILALSDEMEDEKIALMEMFFSLIMSQQK